MIHQECSNSLAKLQEMVETTVDLEALDNHEFIIKPEFDDDLRSISKRLEKIRKTMQVEHSRVGDDLDQDIDKKLFLENHKVHGWCFRLTRNVSRQCAIYHQVANDAVGSRLHPKQEAIQGMLDTKERRLLHHRQIGRAEKRI